MSLRRVLFQTVGGETIGLGHVRRSLALADALRALGTEVRFAVAGDRRAVELIRVAGFEATLVAPSPVERPPHDVDAVVVDDYGISAEDLARLASERMVVVIDDLGDRALDVQMVVNGSAGASALRYRVGARTRLLLGPHFIPLRAEFGEPPARTVSDAVKRLLLTVGGGNPGAIIERLIATAGRALPNASIDVIVGPLATPTETLARAAGTYKDTVMRHEDPKDVRALMLAADLAISGGGQTLYELAATGTPTVGVRLADNQTLNLRNLHAEGTLLSAGDAADADLETALTPALRTLAESRERRAEMSRRGRALVDGQGAARVAEALLDEMRR
jgi:UDP-2,4-diacetamido-2,4,6-trideoxy-beta-L-altropyranose hydrolase